MPNDFDTPTPTMRQSGEGVGQVSMFLVWKPTLHPLLILFPMEERRNLCHPLTTHGGRDGGRGGCWGKVWLFGSPKSKSWVTPSPLPSSGGSIVHRVPPIFPRLWQEMRRGRYCRRCEPQDARTSMPQSSRTRIILLQKAGKYKSTQQVEPTRVAGNEERGGIASCYDLNRGGRCGSSAPGIAAGSKVRPNNSDFVRYRSRGMSNSHSWCVRR